MRKPNPPAKIWRTAKVLDASDRSYSAAVLALFAHAKKEIFVSLYLLEPADNAPATHPVNALLEALLAARKRSVRVRILLNTNFRFTPKSGVGTGLYFSRLLEAGAELTSLLPGRRLHDKLILIDSRYVVEASMNWSIAALMSNYESATIIDSPAHARKKRERLEKLLQPVSLVEKTTDSAFLAPPPEVKIPLALFDQKYFPAMIGTSGERAFDLYLILLGQAAASEKNEIALDLETAGRALKMPASWPRSAVRRQMIKVLRSLETRYPLIQAEFPYAGNPRIKLRNLPGENFTVPGGLVEPNFLASQPASAIYMALCGEVLKREGLDIHKLTAVELEKRFFVDHETFSAARRII